MKSKSLIAVMTVFAILAAACGSDEDVSTTPTPTTAVAAPATTAAAPATSAAAAAAGSAVVGLDIDAILGADLASCAAAPSGDPIRVGMAMDFSDVVGFVDIPGSNLVPYVAELINCTGGINGSPVEVRVAEVGDDAALAAQELLDWGAQFLIGPPFADFALPILQTTGGNVPLFVAASTEPTLADASINSYLVTFDDFAMSGAAAQWALDQGITRAIVFTEGEGIPYTGVNPDAFAAAFVAGGGEVVSTQTYVWAADTDFSAQVNEIAGISENNEVVFSAALAFQVTALRGQLEGQGLDGLTYIGTDAMDATGIQVEANNEGIAHTPHTSISAGDPIDTLLAGYESSRGEALASRGFMALYVDSLFLGIQGMLDCDCTEPADIGEAVKQISGFQGLSGEITYAGTNGIPPKAVPINQIVNGEDVLVATVSGTTVTVTPAAAAAAAAAAGSAVVGLDIDAILGADLASCAAAPSGDPIRVGMAMDFSDVVGFVDIPGSNLVPYVAELINCTGGINGSPVEVRVAEVGDDAALAAQELLDWGAQFLIGPPFADFALPILQTTGGNVPLFVAASTEPTLADASINSYLVTFDDFAMSGAAAQWALDQGITRAIVFTEGEGIPYTGVNPDAFAAAFVAGGGEVVSTQTYVWAADTDFSAQVNEIAGISENNEVVFSAALAFQVTALRGQLEGQGLDGLTYIGTDAMDATGIQVEANNEGIAHTPHTSISAGDPIDTLLAGYESSRGEALASRGFMALYVDSLFLGIQGMLDCDCTEPADIGEAVKQISGFQGLSGEITYAGTNGIPPKAVPINQIVNGEDVLVATIGG
jgi:branched-chain amino acid transport system substrate-binding protein